MSASTTKPTATGNVSEAARGAVAGVNVALPATIVSYDDSEQRAVVKIVPCRRRKTSSGGEECYRPDPVAGVPVLFPGAGDISLTWPLAQGDAGLLVFCDRSIDEWKSTSAAETEPQDPRRHDLTDAVFIPGLRSFASPIPSAGVDGTAAVLRAAEIKLGSSSATKAVALDPDVQSAMSTLETALITAGNAAAAAAPSTPGDGGAGAFAAFVSSLTTSLAAWPPSMGASKVKAE